MFQPFADITDLVKYPPDPVVAQIVVQCQCRRAGVDTHHVARDPLPVFIDIAEAVTPASLQFAFVLSLISIL